MTSDDQSWHRHVDPAFYTRWAQMLAWTVCIGCLVRACSRERAYAPNRDRLSLPLLGAPPLIDPLDVTHGVLRCWRAGVWGGLGVGPPARFRRQVSQCPSHSGVLPARLLPCVCGSLPPREGGLYDR